VPTPEQALSSQAPDATPAAEAAAWLLDPSAPRPKRGLPALLDVWEREAQAPEAQPNPPEGQP
jgi:hypothetical protein